MQKYSLYQLRSLGVRVLHEDDSFLVLDKPSGLLVIPDRYDPTLPSLQSALHGAGEEIFIVHRIDRETSGLVVLARTRSAHAELNTQFEHHVVEKKYSAICKGGGEAEGGSIDLPLGEHPSTHRMRVDEKNGKPSRTEYTILRRFRGFAYVEAIPKSGRTHQIRVHLAAVGLPILGDPLYGDARPFRLSGIKRNYKQGKEEEKPLLARTALHASLLTFTHPVSGRAASYTSDLPKDMRSTLRAIEKYAGEGS